MRWPLQPLQPLQQTQLQPLFGQSVDSLCHPWFTTTNVSYRFPILKLPPPPCAVLLVYLPLWKLLKSMGRMIPYMKWTIKFMFQPPTRNVTFPNFKTLLETRLHALVNMMNRIASRLITWPQRCITPCQRAMIYVEPPGVPAFLWEVLHLHQKTRPTFWWIPTMASGEKARDPARTSWPSGSVGIKEQLSYWWSHSERWGSLKGSGCCGIANCSARTNWKGPPR